MVSAIISPIASDDTLQLDDSEILQSLFVHAGMRADLPVHNGRSGAARRREPAERGAQMERTNHEEEAGRERAARHLRKSAVLPDLALRTGCAIPRAYSLDPEFERAESRWAMDGS